MEDKKIDNSEPAFPVVGESRYDRHDSLPTGLTKREYFAAKALTLFPLDKADIVLLQSGRPPDHELVAKFCVCAADALLAELKKGAS